MRSVRLPLSQKPHAVNKRKILDIRTVCQATRATYPLSRVRTSLVTHLAALPVSRKKARLRRALIAIMVSVTDQSLRVSTLTRCSSMFSALQTGQWVPKLPAL